MSWFAFQIVAAAGALALLLGAHRDTMSAARSGGKSRRRARTGSRRP